MSNAAISAALATQLDTLDLPTQWENSDFDPPASTVYLAESLLPGETLPVGIASQASDQFSGIYQVLVYAPLGANKGAGRSTADLVAGAFVRGSQHTYDGVTVTILRTSEAPSFLSGDRWVIPVSVNYRAFT